MKKKWPAVVVSDLDGTLLNSRDYSFEEAEPALAALKKRVIPVVLVSSKTRTEIDVIRASLGLEHPFVVENGGAAYVPRSYFEGVGEVIRWGVSYQELVGALGEVRRQTGARLRGFADADVEEVRRRTGLTREEAQRSKQREFDEPFWFEGGEDERSRKALGLLEAQGLTVTRGGRFYHVMGNCDKGRAVRELLSRYGGCPSAGLGDAENDLSFLQVVDRPYIVAGPDGVYDPALLEVMREATRVAPAPRGWGEAVSDFLSWLDRKQVPGT